MTKNANANNTQILTKNNQKTAIVIGSGFGGLSMAIRLQALGFKTKIFEKNPKVGGHAYQIKKDGYTFDMGPSIVTIPFLFKELFELNNENFKDYIDLTSLDPFYRIYYHDKSYIDYTGDLNKMKAEIAKFNKEDAQNYDSFMEYSKSLYKIVVEDKLGEQPFTSWSDFLNFLPIAIKNKAILPCYTVASKYFKDFRTRFLFSFHSLFLGGNPFSVPSIFLMLPYLEKSGGVWFAKGGMYKIVTELAELFKRMGGEIYTNSEVEEILIKNGIARGVHANNTEHLADLIVSNAHFAHTYMNLINKEKRQKWTDKAIQNKKYTMSCYLLYLGTKKKYPQLLHHTLILSKRYKGLVKDIFDNKALSKDFSMYLHVPSRTDADMAPEGCESIYLLIPTPNLAADIDWNKETQPFTERVLDFLEKDFGMEDLRENIEVLETFTPLDFAKQRNNYLGACWSLQPNLTQIANMRPQNKSEEFENLYLVGASTHPGAGVPGVILSAKATEKLIKKDFGI